MIIDPYARSVKLSVMENMEREREMARQRKWIAIRDKKRKEKMQALWKHERVKRRFIAFKDRVLVYLVSMNLDSMKHRVQQQRHREWLASRDTFETPEDPDYDPYE